FKAGGSLSRYKARLVANGRSQQQGIDFDETFSPVIKPATIRTVLSLAVSRDWPIHQLDVKNAFLHGHLSETVYMHQPPGFVDPNKPASSSVFLQRIIASLHSEFAMTDLGSLNYFLGIFAQRSASGLFLSQSKYAEEILERAHIHNCNSCRTLVDTESKLSSDGDPISDPTLYRSLAGALQYLTFTRPDLSYALHVSSTTQLSAYIDADWAGCPVTREYRGVANVVAETAWISNLLCELHTPLFIATLVYCDNVSVVYMSANPVQHQCTKHIEIDIHFVRDFVASGKVRVLHVPSRFQYADILRRAYPLLYLLSFAPA
nr:hypothetical protein [Tanacetum cinerariifolium]